MAEMTFNTRIINKHDVYEQWQASSLVLKNGEVVVCTIPADTGAVQGEPVVMFKVGDGEKTFKDLPWTAARAADVYSWAKEPNKPTYEASEITGIAAYIAEYVESEMGISVDTDTQYQVVKVDDYIVAALLDFPGHILDHLQGLPHILPVHAEGIGAQADLLQQGHIFQFLLQHRCQRPLPGSGNGHHIKEALVVAVEHEAILFRQILQTGHHQIDVAALHCPVHNVVDLAPHLKLFVFFRICGITPQLCKCTRCHMQIFQYHCRNSVHRKSSSAFCKPLFSIYPTIFRTVWPVLFCDRFSEAGEIGSILIFRVSADKLKP